MLRFGGIGNLLAKLQMWRHRQLDDSATLRRDHLPTAMAVTPLCIQAVVRLLQGSLPALRLDLGQRTTAETDVSLFNRRARRHLPGVAMEDHLTVSC